MDGAPQEPKNDIIPEDPRGAAGGVEEETREGSPSASSALQSVADYLSKVNSLSKKKQNKDALHVCNEALTVYPGNNKLLEKKTKVLCQLLLFQDALKVVEDWILLDPQNTVARREHEKLKIILTAVECPDSEDDSLDNDDKAEQVKPTEQRAGRNKIVAAGDGDTLGNKSAFKALGRSSSPQRKNEEAGQFVCTSCEVSFTQKDEFDLHSTSGFHKQRLAVEDAHQWQYRAPPRGLASDEYSLCKRFMETGRCTFREKCTRAHSEAELEEWNHRYAVRKQQLQQSQENRAHGGTYIEQLLEKLMSQEPPKMVLVENIDLVKIHVNSDLKVSMSTKKCTNAWTFTVTSKLCLHCVALMSDTNRSYFHVSSISVGPRKTQKYQNLEPQCQEWVNQDTQSKGQGEYVYRVKVVFKTDIYGTFRQSIVFDFGVEAILMREVQVESAPATDAEKIRKEITLTEAHRWNERTVTLVNFEPRPVSYSEPEAALMAKYMLPRPDKFCQPETVMHSISKENYRLWMHEMLYIEEMAQVGYISRFNVTTSLQLVNRFLLMPSSLSTAKYAQGGELFARMKLEDDLSEDSMAGRLILQSSNVAWIAEGKKERPDKVYEAVIEDKGKNFIFMRLSKTCVEELGLSCDQDFNAQIQFQLNRLSMCEMHSAVDRLPTLDIVFPDLDNLPDKLELDDSVLQDSNESKRLNEKQKDAVRLILAAQDLKLPPLLIVGPFGTGKTFTMAQAAKQVLKQEGTRILICTHSNSAADLYIKEFLHDYVETDDHAEARPLRVMYKFRWIQTVPEVVLEYTLLEREGPMAGTFRPPTVEDVMKHRVIIATLSSARYLVDLDLPKDAFSHIFIDEAAQSLESETIIPLSLAHENTRIVFAGDHMQMSPEVYSDFTRQQGFHTSLLERLHELYPKDSVYMVMLCENYRAHAAIVDFTSELFYDNKLISSGNIIAHDQFYPLTFFAAKGEEIQHENSTGFYNMSEVYEIVERVDELKKKWPEAWGAFDNNGISIVAPYSDQVARIRAELRKRKLFNVNVERVLNVQGKQYRVIMLSITRTRLTCRSDPNVEEYLDFGFLSNIKLLNTAITRAQSLVVVVGDPVSVCLVGKCRKIWEYFLEICHYNDSLHGISWIPLREQLDRAELTKSFVLNPLAPEFIPNRLYHTSHASQQDHSVFYPGVPHFGGWPAYPGMMPGTFPQMFPPMYQHPMYFPYNAGLVPTMYYPQTLGRGFIPNRQMLGRFIPPPGGFSFSRGTGPVRDGIQRTVEMPGGRNVRHAKGRHMYYSPPRVQSFAAVPGYPLLQPPQHPSGGYFYHLPEDPRALAFSPAHSSIHPYLTPGAQFSAHSIRQPAAFGTLPHHPGSGFHPLPHGSSPNFASTRVFYQDPRLNRERSDTGDSRMSDSPSSGIQLLPNVKHVPAHLRGKPGETSPEQPGSNSTTPPINAPIGTPMLRDERTAALSNRPYSPANYVRERSGSAEMVRSYSPANFIREHAGDDIHSRRSYSPANYPRDERRSSADDVNSSHERSMSLSPPVAPSNMMPPDTGQQEQRVANTNGTSKLNSRRQKPNLSLRTGFSRQYSDDLPTPTVITNMIQMIDENIDEGSTEEDSPSTTGERKHLRLKMSVAQRLQHMQAIEGSEASSSSTPPSVEDSHPSYASMVRASPRHITAEEAAQLEIQTPRTPKGFITPGAEVEVDPFGILKSLNIGGAPHLKD
ncbi:probable helicase with zinc finger domain [Physella acuta]|uniref:probable helicase with zinc finger domain n=1 Tax=Physella acuta TaxID=109671 RepID=UPI0027DAF654|nr:probable helicase with zinc finger domain [Physella acuta]XP_059155157.1 probable helicase with zinc finger domain [Physella acuta]